MYNTFNGWKRLGRVVVAGHRGCFRNEYGDMMYHFTKTTHRGAPLVCREYIVRRPVAYYSY